MEVLNHLHLHGMAQHVTKRVVCSSGASGNALGDPIARLIDNR